MIFNRGNISELTTLEIVNEAMKYSSLAQRLNNLAKLRERPDFHPEPNAFVHTMIVMGRLIETNQSNDLILAGLLHDICKPETAKPNKRTGWPMCAGHAEWGGKLIEKTPEIQQFILRGNADAERVMNLVKWHNNFHQLNQMKETKKVARIKLWKELGIWEDLHILCAADNMMIPFFEIDKLTQK